MKAARGTTAAPGDSSRRRSPKKPSSPTKTKKRMTMTVKGSSESTDGQHPIQKLIAGFCKPPLQTNSHEDEDKTQETYSGGGENDDSCVAGLARTSINNNTLQSNDDGSNSNFKNRSRGLTIDTSMAGTATTEDGVIKMDILSTTAVDEKVNSTGNGNGDGDGDGGIPTTVTMRKAPVASSFDEEDDEEEDDDDDDDDIDVTGNSHEQAAAMRIEVTKRVRKQRQKHGISIFLVALVSVVATLYALKELGYNIANIDDRQSLIEDGTQFMSELVHYSDDDDDDDEEEEENHTKVPPIVRHARKIFNFDIVWKKNQQHQQKQDTAEIGSKKVRDTTTDDDPTNKLPRQQKEKAAAAWSSSSIFGNIVKVKRKEEEDDADEEEQDIVLDLSYEDDGNELLLLQESKTDSSSSSSCEADEGTTTKQDEREESSCLEEDGG